MSVQIQVRRDTAANWTSTDPTLVDGEYGYEKDTGKLKIGNGTDAWTTLAYFGESGYNTIQEEGSNLTQRTTVNFIGSGITAEDNSTNTRTNITLDALLNSIADLTATSGTLELTGTDTVGTYTVTAFAKTVLDDTNVTSVRSTLGLGSAATSNASSFLLVASNLSDLNNTATARTNLGLGTASTQATTVFAQVANNLSDLANTGTARTNINAQIGIAFQDESTTTGTTGAISVVNFVGSGVSVTAAASTLTVSVASGAGDVTAASNIGDNRLVRGDGGGKGIQQTGITIDDSNNMTNVVNLYLSNLVASSNIIATGGAVIAPQAEFNAVVINNGGRLSAGDGGVASIEIGAYDTDTLAWNEFITIDSASTPTCDLDTAVTINNAYIYRAGGAVIPIADGGTGSTTATNARTALNAQVAIAFQDETTTTGTTGAISTVNFIGAGVTASASGSTLTVSIPGGAGSGYQTIQEEGSGLTQRTTLNFIGSGFTAADDAGNTRTNLTLDALLNAIADVTATSGTLEMTGTDTVGTYTVTAFAKTVLDDTNVTSVRSTLGLGSAALSAATSFLLAASNLSDLADTATARSNLGLGTASTRATTFFAQVASNLSDMANTATARGNIGAAYISQTKEYVAALIPSPSNADYPLVIKIPHAGTITTAYAKSDSGTGTATFKVNGTALGGGANSVSSTISTISHSTTNTFSAGDTISLTVSGNSSLVNMNFTLQYTRTYE